MASHLEQFVVVLPLVIYRPHGKGIQVVERNLQWKKVNKISCLFMFANRQPTSGLLGAHANENFLTRFLLLWTHGKAKSLFVIL